MERLAHVVNVLTVENARLVEQQQRQLGWTVTPKRTPTPGDLV